MKLVASVIVRNEEDRYLAPWLEHLLDFCDQIVAIDDASDDSRPLIGSVSKRFVTLRNPEPKFFEHEGRARQHLLDVTLAVSPTHVVALDADEFVSDGAAVRRACESGADVMSLEMREAWKAQPDCLCVRGDGGWRPHPVHALWRVPADTSRLRIADRALACGRVPEVVDQTRALPTGAAIYHFGWANEAERVARHERYAVADGGRFHASAHLDSIMWPDERVAMGAYDWPAALAPVRERILERSMRGAL